MKLANPLAGDPELFTELLEGGLLAVIEAVAAYQNVAQAFRERFYGLAQQAPVFAVDQLLFRVGCVLFGQEIPELLLTLVVSQRPVQAHDLPPGFEGFVHLLDRTPEPPGYLFARRLAAELRGELRPGA